MSGDATIYSYGTMNAMFSGTGSGSGPTLDMAGYTLTIRGAKSTSVFRPRWKWSVKNAGPMIVQNGQFARHLTTNAFSSQVPRVTFTDGAKMAAYNTDSFWKFFDSFEFDGTAVLDAGNASPSLSTISMKELIGPAKITAAATVTVANRYIAHGDDLVAGKFLSATNALAFGEGAVIEVDRLAEMALSNGESYTLMESAGGFSGSPALAGDAAEIFTLATANDGKALVITAKPGCINAIKDWGLALGAEAAAANAEVVAAELATLADNTVVFFPGGVYHFGEVLDLSALTAQNVRFVAGKAVIASPVTLPEAEGFEFNFWVTCWRRPLCSLCPRTPPWAGAMSLPPGWIPNCWLTRVSSSVVWAHSPLPPTFRVTRCQSRGRGRRLERDSRQPARYAEAAGHGEIGCHVVWQRLWKGHYQPAAQPGRHRCVRPAWRTRLWSEQRL